MSIQLVHSTGTMSSYVSHVSLRQPNGPHVLVSGEGPPSFPTGRPIVQLLCFSFALALLPLHRLRSTIVYSSKVLVAMIFRRLEPMHSRKIASEQPP